MKRSMLAVMAAGAMIAPLATPAQARSLSADAAVTAHKVAKCIYARRPADVAAALGTTAAGDYQRYHAILSRSPQCRDIGVESAMIDGATVVVPADILRGMLAEEALAGSRFRSLQPVQSGADYKRPWFAATGRPAAVDEMAVCTAEQNPAGVRVLIEAQPESSGELEAIQGLSATLGACLPQGATLSANRQSLRAALADALYQRAIAPAMAAK